MLSFQLSKEKNINKTRLDEIKSNFGKYFYNNKNSLFLIMVGIHNYTEIRDIKDIRKNGSLLQ